MLPTTTDTKRIRRSYETIGIGPVFLDLSLCSENCDENHKVKIKDGASGDKDESDRDILDPNIDSLEATIKQTPEDFRVMEIGLDGSIARLDCSSEDITEWPLPPSRPTNDDNDDDNDNSRQRKRMRVESTTELLPLEDVLLRYNASYSYIDRSDNNCSGSSCSVIEALNEFHEKVKRYLQLLSSLPDVLKSNVVAERDPSNSDKDNSIKDISKATMKLTLNLSSLEEISCENSTDKCKVNEVGDMERVKKKVRGLFHRAFKSRFPLLEAANQSQRSNDDIILLFVKADDCFHCIAQYLQNPVRDIMNLTSFFIARHSSLKQNEVSLKLLSTVKKEDRKDIHKAISSVSRDLETSTQVLTNENGCDEQFIIVKYSKRFGKKRHKTNQAMSSALSAHVIKCIMEKTQLENLDCIQKLSRALNCKPVDIGLAGIKDKFAITSQNMTIRNVSKSKIINSITRLSDQRIKLGKFSYCKHNAFLSTGKLLGNRFIIVMRNLRVINTGDSCSKKRFEQMISRIRRNGYINFYGQQRVGSPGNAEVGVQPFDIGRALLQEDYNGAIDLIMSGRKITKEVFVENLKVREFRKFWFESGRDVNKTLKKMPNNSGLHREKMVLQALKRYGEDDPCSAITSLPFTVRSFWISAYQSYIWNIAASERIRLMGSKATCGDIYDDGNGSILHIDSIEMAETIRIDQVVLPLPGYSVRYPTHDIGKLYMKILSDDCINFANICKHKKVDRCAKGCYRKLISQAEKVEWSMLDESNREGYFDNNAVTSAVISFDLPKGSYATMVLRELMLTTFE